jgi:catechol 2,3-dioxygenase-like lactoylglutathione lyase family enzyme
VFDHVELPVTDLAQSVAFYELVLEPLGIQQANASAKTVELGALSLVPRRPRETLHLAFIAESREAVEEFHRRGVEAGYRDNGAPGLREYATDYFAAYLLDPDGHNVEAVHRSPETRARWDWLGLGLVRDGS